MAQADIDMAMQAAATRDADFMATDSAKSCGQASAGPSP
jgi:hypothetical protein